MPTSPKNKQELEAMLNAKAWKDPKFKKKLLEDPKSALKELGVDVPAKLKVRIIEDDKNTVTFVLLPTPDNASKMEEDELRKVAGGKAGCDYVSKLPETFWPECARPGPG